MPAHAPHTTLSDEDLLQVYRTTGQNQFLGVLLQRYTGLLLGVAMKYLKDRTLAEDAVQQVFEAALTHLPTEPILNFKGWLYILMRNHCLQQLRHKTYIAGEELIEALPYDIGTGTEEAHQLEHTLQQMTEAIELLSEEQRSTITLFYLQRHTYEQIIERTGYTFMQVKSYIQNGRRNLKTILSKKLGNTRP